MRSPGGWIGLGLVLLLIPMVRADSQWPAAVVPGARVQVRLPRATSALIHGVRTGLAFALIVGSVYGLDDDSSLSFGEAALAGGGIGLVIGGVAGAIRPEERWRRVHVGVSVPAP